VKSLGQKIKSLAGLLGTKDLTEWEDGFIESIVRQTDEGEHTTSLTPKQVEVLDRLHGKHFAG